MTEEMGLQMFLKADTDDADVTFSGSVPQSGSSDRKSSMVERRVRGTTSDDVDHHHHHHHHHHHFLY